MGRVRDRTRTGACRYLVMEQGPVTVDAWAQRMKRSQFHYFAHAPQSLYRPIRKRDAFITTGCSSLLSKFH
jgi:hypothetical protein